MIDLCRICGSGNVVFFESFHGKTARCSTCHAITRLLSYGEYTSLDPTYDPGPSVEGSDSREIQEYLGVSTKRKFLEPLVQRVGRPCRLLDIGCGAGGYLLAAKELGCTAIGVEPSETHSTIARGLGLDVTSGFFRAEDFTEASFDLVVLSHVIEHIYDPMAFLSSIMTVVRPGGILVIVTPNADSSVARLSGRHWVMLKPIDHVSMLCERALLAAGIARLGQVEFLQSEYPWEPVASLASAARSAMAGGSPPHAEDKDGRVGSTPKPYSTSLWKSRFTLMKKAMGIVAFPLHSLNRALDAQASLVTLVSKSVETIEQRPNAL